MLSFSRLTELSEQIRTFFLIRLGFSGRNRQLIMNDHDGPGVVPGRYAREAIRSHDGPTPQQVANEQQRVEADGLAGRICAAAADAARSQYVLLELLGEFDSINAIWYWTDFKSLAHWLSWSCSMTPGVAREHVRVAKALRRMPTITRLFEECRLSYSKVREVTRVVDIVDDQKLSELALTATASQLARVISGFRSADGMRMPQQTKRRVSWHERADGMVEFRARLPKDEAAVLIAAIDTAKDQFGPPPAKPDPCADQEQEPATGVGTYGNADALVDVARGFLNAAPQDRSGEDRTLVVVHVSAEQLAGNVPAATSDSDEDVAAGSDTDSAGNDPAATPPTAAVCHIEGIGSVEAATAQKHACDSALLGAVVDKHGRVLALGGSRRLVSKAQRRALMIRDKMCRYPGCDSARHLKAHHVVPWILGGRTDLDNLILLCQWHHTVVHEGGVTITGEPDRWQFQKPDRQPCQPWVDDENLAQHLDFARRRVQRDAAKPDRTKHDAAKHDAAKHDAARQDRLAGADSFQHPEAKTIRARWAGEPFDLHACVRALFTIKLPEPTADLDQQAA
jgi:hypothetical protein